LSFYRYTRNPAAPTVKKLTLNYRTRVSLRPRKMELDEFNQKLDQIEEQAQLTPAEFPKTLTKERQRMIIALVRYIRAEAERSALFSHAETEAQAGTRLRSI